MTLLECQQQFALMVPRLILQAAHLGYAVTLGDAYRDPRAPYGHPRSLHRSRLAIDLNLYADNGTRYIVNDEGHRELHEWWEGIGGAKMIENDANHYSLQWTAGVR
jgi:hypothetical protein